MKKYAKMICGIIEASHGHLTAEQIYEELRRTYPAVVLATVYNNLNRLCSEGSVRRISLEGQPDRFDVMVRHDHLVCRNCGKLLDIDLGDLTEQLQKQVKVKILSYDLKLICLCEECENKKEFDRNGGKKSSG